MWVQKMEKVQQNIYNTAKTVKGKQQYVNG